MACTRGDHNPVWTLEHFSQGKKIKRFYQQTWLNSFSWLLLMGVNLIPVKDTRLGRPDICLKVDLWAVKNVLSTQNWTPSMIKLITLMERDPL